MKITRIQANNRKKALELEASGAEYSFPFARLPSPPSRENRVAEVWVDPDLGSEGFSYRLEDGTEDAVHFDAVLEYNQDPDYLKSLLLHRLTIEAQRAVEGSDVSKRELIRRLGTSASQFYRLLDPTNSTKSLGQMLALLHLVGRDVEVVITSKAEPVRRRAPSRGKAAV